MVWSSAGAWLSGSITRNNESRQDDYWIMSDTHFGHHKLIHEGHRPPECYKKMMDSVKNLSEKDVLIHLGDFSFYGCELWHNAFREACKCKLWLIKGNHDRRTNAWYLSHGWDFVADRMRIHLLGKRIIFTHRPYHFKSLEGNKINVHGHLHNTRHHGEFQLHEGKHFLVKREHDYRPVNLRTLIGM